MNLKIKKYIKMIPFKLNFKNVSCGKFDLCPIESIVLLHFRTLPLKLCKNAKIRLSRLQKTLPLL
jgi:hypothetical protein